MGFTRMGIIDKLQKSRAMPLDYHRARVKEAANYGLMDARALGDLPANNNTNTQSPRTPFNLFPSSESLQICQPTINLSPTF